MHGTEIFAAARAKGVMVAFEAAVAGGIPIIKALREGLTANRIEVDRRHHQRHDQLHPVEMRDKGLDFDAVLKEAQRLGYAEADPTFDIEGVDAAHKATIMSAIAFGIPVQFDKAYTSRASPSWHAADIRLRRAARLPHQAAGHHRAATGGIELRVHPTLDAGQAADRQRRGRDERRGGARRRRRHHAVLRQGRRRRADRLGGDRRPGRHHALHTADPDHRVPHLAFQPARCPTRRILPIAEVVTASTCACGGRPGGRAGAHHRHPGRARHLDRRVLQRESAEGENQTDVIIPTHDTVEGRWTERARADAGAADGARAHRAHPQRS